MEKVLSDIRRSLKEHSTTEAEISFRKFIPSDEKILAVRTPVISGMASKYKSYRFPLIEALWKSPFYEEKMLAIKILSKVAKDNPEKSLRLVRSFSNGITNWAICDAIGMQALKPIVASHQKSIFKLAEGFNKSKDPWQRRLSLVLVEWYTRFPEHKEFIDRLTINLENDEDFYVRKAVVWIKRNYSKSK